MRKGKFWSLRSTQVSGNIIISTIAIFFIIILINFLALKYPLRLDLTETNIYSLSPQSQALVKNLTQPLNIYVFDFPPNNADIQLLKNYSRYNPLFSFEFVNPQVDIRLTQKFQVSRRGDVYIEYNDRQRIVQSVSPQTRLSEVKISSTIAQIQRDIKPTIYILQGNGEPSIETPGENSLSQATQALRDRGYIINPLNLSTSPLIPPDADVLIISDSRKSLSQAEINPIKQYLERGGNLLLMYNYQTAVTLEEILAEWGITFHDSLVVDSSGAGEIFGYGPSIALVISYGEHPITSDFSNGITILPQARPIIIEEKEKIKATPLLISNSQSWGETDLESETLEFNEKTDLPAPLNLAVALIKKNTSKGETNISEISPLENNNQEIKEELEEKTESKEGDLPPPPTMGNPNPQENTSTNTPSPKDSKIVAIGNVNFATDGWFRQQLNGDFFLNSLAWLAGENQETLSIAPKEFINRRLNITPIQGKIITWFSIVILPSLGFLYVIFRLWQRNK